MRTLNDYFVYGEIADISTASSTFVAVPDGGNIIKIATALQGAISGGNAAITFELGGTAVTNGGITVAHSGSAAGDVDTALPTAANAVGMMTLDGDVRFAQGDSFYIQSNAQCSNNNTTIYVNYIIRR